ncbi:MAG: helix-turn-helix transcriptional regulator [Clostridia bacterium]|nr:helix-turn-helix transcriptional regulator [Clostridia bacterium]
MIREKRNQFGYTQEEMANMLEISLRQYVRIDKELCLPRTDILDKLISMFNLSNEEIGIYVKTVLYKKIS